MLPPDVEYRHTFKARSIEDDCYVCGERYAHPKHYGIALIHQTYASEEKNDNL